MPAAPQQAAGAAPAASASSSKALHKTLPDHFFRFIFLYTSSKFY